MLNAMLFWKAPAEPRRRKPRNPAPAHHHARPTLL